MAAIYAITGHIWAGFSFISLIATIVIYAVCFWLTIGYGQLGYGTRQYEILQIPWLCTTSTVSFETDPRRGNFVGLHVATFIMGTLGLIMGLPKICRELTTLEQVDFRRTKWILATIFVLPQFIGIVISAADHSYPYLILNQDGCFASFVSGYRGYTELIDVPWIVKVATIIGLNS